MLCRYSSLGTEVRIIKFGSRPGFNWNSACVSQDLDLILPCQLFPMMQMIVSNHSGRRHLHPCRHCLGRLQWKCLSCASIHPRCANPLGLRMHVAELLDCSQESKWSARKLSNQAISLSIRVQNFSLQTGLTSAESSSILAIHETWNPVAVSANLTLKLRWLFSKSGRISALHDQ